jgi:hypothetical protein
MNISFKVLKLLVKNELIINFEEKFATYSNKIKMGRIGYLPYWIYVEIKICYMLIKIGKDVVYSHKKI